MDATPWIIAAAVIVIALVVYRYRREIDLRFKGWGVETALNAKGDALHANGPPGARNVSIGGDAKRNLINTGDVAGAAKPTAAAGRNVSIGGNADGNTIVTGDRNKIGR
jgi:hypothetical protein